MEQNSQETELDGANGLLGLLVYVQLVSFNRLAKDSGLAPTVSDAVELARIAALELSDLEEIAAEQEADGIDFEAAMEPFFGCLADADVRTRPKDWYERIVKSHVTLGVLHDFVAFAAADLPHGGAEVLSRRIISTQYNAYVMRILEPAVHEDQRLMARLGLWGRRVYGEVVHSVRLVLRRHPYLLAHSLEGETELLARLQAAHVARLEVLGITS